MPGKQFDTSAPVVTVLNSKVIYNEGEALEDIEIFRSRYGGGGYSQHLYSRLDVAYEERAVVQDAYTDLSGYGYLDLNQRVWREEFSYDSRGNRTQQTSPWGTLESSYNAASQLLQTGNRSFAYDDNGNLINGQLGDQITSYEYDGRNRLVSVQDSITLPKHPWNSFWHNRGDGSINPFTRDVSYGYDALGRRISETEVGEHPWDYYLPGKGRKSGDTDVATRHEVTVYRGLGFDPLARLETANYVPRVGSWFGSWLGSWSGGPKGNSRPGYRFFPFQRHLDDDFEVLDVYTRANGDVLVEASVSGGSKKGNGWGWGYGAPNPQFSDKTYYHTDQLGSAVLMTDDRGARKIDVSYDAFGQVMGKTVPDLDFGYNGKPLDSVTGLYNYGFRDYDPGSGRFTTVDPIRDGNNWYGYVNSDPVNRIDPLGLWEEYIENEVTSNLDQPYVSGINDCDIWVETRLTNAGATIPEQWTPATTTTVAQQIQNFNGLLMDEPAQGTNIVFFGGNHAMLVALNADGSVDVAHQSSNPGYSEEMSYTNTQTFTDDWSPYGTIQYYPLNDAAAPVPAVPDPTPSVPELSGAPEAVPGNNVQNQSSEQDQQGKCGQ